MKADAKTIIRKVAASLKDAKGTRWPAPELVQYLNDAQRAIVARRPDASAVTQEVTLTQGPRQVLPAEAATLIDVPRNATGRKRQITKVDQRILDATSPAWYSAALSEEIKHFMHDPRDPRVYLVFPPARPTARVELQYAARPADVALPLGSTFAAVTGNCALDEEWADAIYHFILYRAYYKDAEFGANAAMATAQLGLYKAELGEPLQSSAVVAATS